MFPKLCCPNGVALGQTTINLRLMPGLQSDLPKRKNEFFFLENATLVFVLLAAQKFQATNVQMEEKEILFFWGESRMVNS